jgi:hypothetical protein
MKYKRSKPIKAYDNGAGVFISICPHRGRINDIYITATNDREAAIVQGAFARIIKPSHWGWLKRLIGFAKG